MASNDKYNTYSEEEYNKAYIAIYQSLTMARHTRTGKCAYVLGGQPGSGKTDFYSKNEALSSYIAIDGDQYRKYHPRYDEIIACDFDNYPEYTQPFVNKIVEQLIDELSANGYDLIIEGTLRDPDVSIKTCDLLRGRGYLPRLVVVACDAEQSWKSTISRAQLMQEFGEKPRLVPINKYHTIVNSLPTSLDIIYHEQCFSSISVIGRDNRFLYKNGSQGNPADVLRDALNLDNWNDKLEFYIDEYLDLKEAILQAERGVCDGQESVSCSYEEVSSRDS